VQGVEKALIQTGCSVAYCLNGGMCLEHSGMCQCPAGYQGSRCQVRVTSHGYDVTDPCVAYRCLHGGQCMVELDNDGRGRAICRCPDNWAGKHCQVSVCTTLMHVHTREHNPLKTAADNPRPKWLHEREK